MTNAPDLLKKACETMLERSVERDTDKERAMNRTVAMFNAAFGTNLTEYQGWIFMLFLKMARAHGGCFREDDYLDMAAYAALAGECRGQTEELLVPSKKIDPDHATIAQSWKDK